MIAKTEFSCYGPTEDSQDTLLGRCVVFEGTEESEAQYLFETLILGRDLERNPFNFNIHVYSGVSESNYNDSENLLPIRTPELLNESYVLTDLNAERDLKLIVGLHYIEDTGEYYLLKVPVNTTRISSEFMEVTFRNESGDILRAEEDSYILIMRDNLSTELEFGSGTITTRSYLIANNPVEMNKLSYLANGSFNTFISPMYYQKTLDGIMDKNPIPNKGKVLRLPTKNNIKVLSSHKESWNDKVDGWKKGDIVLYDTYAFKCLVDYTNNKNFNNHLIWKRV